MAVIDGRLLTAVTCPASSSGVQRLVAALEESFDGGPAVVALPPGPEAAVADLRSALRPDDASVPVDPSDVAVVVATSGSTGEAKGVQLTGSALRHSARATLDLLGGPGAWVLALPVTHIAAVQVVVRSMLADRAPVAVEMADGFTAEAFAAAVYTAANVPGRRYSALVPTQLERVLDGGVEAVDALGELDAVLLGGAAAPPALVARAEAAGVRVVTTYGMSETCGGCVYDGRPLEGVEVRIASPDAGGVGRIELGGPTVFSGYRLRPDLTAAALVDGRHVTNDLGRLRADGTLEVLGRADDVIVSGGEKIAPASVEQCLLAHPSVAACAVVAHPDPTWGQRVVAVIVPSDPSSPPTLDALRDHVGATMPRSAAPRELRIVESLPLLSTGKIDRAALTA